MRYNCEGDDQSKNQNDNCWETGPTVLKIHRGPAMVSVPPPPHTLHLVGSSYEFGFSSFSFSRRLEPDILCNFFPSDIVTRHLTRTGMFNSVAETLDWFLLEILSVLGNCAALVQFLDRQKIFFKLISFFRIISELPENTFYLLLL